MEDKVDAKGEGHVDQADARGQNFPGNYPAQAVPQMKDSDFVSDRYNMKHLNRGVAVIFNNKNFDQRTGMGVRNGTDADCNKMEDLLSQMNFQDIRSESDLTTKNMLQKLKAVSKEDHTDSDCFVCVILTHGEEGYVYGTDDKISLDSLVQPFKGHNCPSLAGKPKLFFIQACRGTELDAGVEVADAATEEAMQEEIVLRRIPTEADFLMAFSVVPGYYAWRNSTNGSWFIQAIYDVFSKNWRTMDVLTMMTRVNKRVAYDFQSNASKEYMTRKKQIPCITSMLTKDVFF